MGWYSEHLAEDFVCINSEGAVRDKRRFLEDVAAGPEVKDVSVRLYGGAALVQAKGVFTRKDGSPGQSRYTDVYVKTGESWRVALLAEAGVSSIACFSTEYSENTFPTLPVRTDVNAFVWLSTFATLADYYDSLRHLMRSNRWMDEVYPELASRFAAAPLALRLEPTPRSLLGNAT